MSDITKQVALRLPSDLISLIDARAEALGISRNQWFENMARWVLANTHTIIKRSDTP
jgi:hypothetical protein